MSKEYGYIGKEVEQGFRSNKGIFTPQDIIELDQENKWTNFGQLELIQTQSASGVTSVDFTSIKEDIYNVHLMTLTNFGFFEQSQNMGFRFYENGVLEDGSVYQYAFQANEVGGTTGNVFNSSSDLIRLDQTGSQGMTLNSYAYFYNLGDSTQYSFTTFHSMVERISSGSYATSSGSKFGRGVLPQASTVDGIRVLTTGSNNLSNTFTISLYGIRSF